MKKPLVEIKSRPNYDIIEITLHSGARIQIKTDNNFNEVIVTHVQYRNEQMFVRSQMGNQFLIKCIENA